MACDIIKNIWSLSPVDDDDDDDDDRERGNGGGKKEGDRNEKQKT